MRHVPPSRRTIGSAGPDTALATPRGPLAASAGAAVDGLVARTPTFDETIRTHGAARGDVLFAQGDGFAGLFRVETGLVGLRMIDADGHMSLLSFAGPGDLVGYMPLLLGGGHSASACVLRPGRVGRVDAAMSRALVRDCRTTMTALVGQAARDLEQLQRKHFRMQVQDAPARLADLLLALVDRGASRPDRDDSVFPLPISRGDIAEYIGTRTETLSRAIRQLREAGVVRITGREVRIASLAHLRRIAESGSGATP